MPNRHADSRTGPIRGGPHWTAWGLHMPVRRAVGGASSFGTPIRLGGSPNGNRRISMRACVGRASELAGRDQLGLAAGTRLRWGLRPDSSPPGRRPWPPTRSGGPGPGRKGGSGIRAGTEVESDPEDPSRMPEFWPGLTASPRASSRCSERRQRRSCGRQGQKGLGASEDGEGLPGSPVGTRDSTARGDPQLRPCDRRPGAGRPRRPRRRRRLREARGGRRGPARRRRPSR